MKKTISILGCTGSIGTQTLDVIRAFPDKFSVKALSSGSNISLLKEQILEFLPAFVSIKNKEDESNVQEFIHKNKIKTEVLTGSLGLETVSTMMCDLLVVAISGTTALWPTYKAIQKKIPIALACKEVLVSAGSIITQLAKENNVPILPIDSEHAALKQCLAGINENRNDVEKLILTASGGPFREFPIEKFHSITIQDALNHPNWAMGKKISIDSATLMNKGLEVIEAHHLYGTPYDKIDVVVHPQSIVHSMVEFIDGTILSQLSSADMRFPIQYALTYPEKWKNSWPKTDVQKLGSLDFYPPDLKKFPLLRLAYECGNYGDYMCAILNAANEAVVNLFLEGKILFTHIPIIIEKILSNETNIEKPEINTILEIDSHVKEKVMYEYN
jgi:1-deoxy-D-xylulose-5-phosphate reductoisomerase